jgi:hypothetical protein
MKALLLTLALPLTSAEPRPNPPWLDAPILAAVYTDGYVHGFLKAKQGLPFC